SARFFAERNRRRKIKCYITFCLSLRESCPRYSELRIEPHCFPKVFLSTKSVGRCGRFVIVSQSAQIGVVSFRIIGGSGGDDLLFLARKFHAQLIGDRFGYIAFYRKNIRQFAIKGVGPKV